MNTKIKVFASALATIVVFALLSFRIGPLPPAGSFFHPIEGFWANAEGRTTTGTMSVTSDKLNKTVEVYYNARGVPHIFAQNSYDLYFAQGYVTARDRLFQLEFQVRGAGGRLSEWLGKELINYDLYQRRLGMVYGAEQTLSTLKGDEIEEMVRAYTDGINSYISSLRYEQFPLEYKILDTEPEEWSQLKTALLLKYMTQMLAGGSRDVEFSNTIAYLGSDFAENYISRPSKWSEPIIPGEQKWDFDPLKAEKPNDDFTPNWVSGIIPYQPDPANGSNNWAVDGSKTASGYPILAGDPHLNMTIPSIWYEMQLHGPGINVYGVTIPGTPSIIKGFNENIAWLNTNTGADVMDWYEIEFRDDSMMEYLYNNEWKPVEMRREVIAVRDGEAVIDTVLFTHHGPVVQPKNEYLSRTNIATGHAMTWIGHFPSDELRAYYNLNRASDVAEAIDALSDFSGPAQNFALADRHGSIALQVAGRFPLKWKKQGQTISDGRNPLYDWQGWIPYEQNPSVINPDLGFVSSANQVPADSTYPYYLGDYFAPFERAKRINEILTKSEDMTAEEMKSMQLDNFSYHAAIALPVMLDYLQTDELSGASMKAFELLQAWNFENLGEEIAPSVFHTWWGKSYLAIWNGLYQDQNEPMLYPSRDRTLQMILEEPDSPWYNNPETEEKENLRDLLTHTYHASIEELLETRGEIGESWKWGYINNTDLNHPARIPGLGETNLFTDGGAESINAIRGGHGPSWRMIVDFGPELRTYGVYPGGQSGNPGSRHYNDFIQPWLKGELFELKLLGEKPEKKQESFPLLLKLN